MHIAILSSASPPLRHVSVKRAYNFAHYLPLLGHRTSLVSADYRFLREDYLESVDEIRISNFIRIDPNAWFSGFNNQCGVYPLEPHLKCHSLLKRVSTAQRMLSGWGPWPSWGKRALEELIKLHKKDPIDVVFAIFGNETTHEVAHQFKKLTRVRWIADFKEPWHHGVEGWARRVRNLQTRRRLKSCWFVTETCELQAEADQNEFGRPCHIIPSGFDDVKMDLANPIVSENRSPIEIYYFGSVGKTHSWQRLIELFKLIDSGPLKNRVSFHWFGTASEDFLESLSRAGVSSYFRFSQPVAQMEAFGRMKGSQLLFLMPAYNLGDEGGAIGVKELEYIAAGRPILCLGKMHEQTKKVVEPQLLHECNSAQSALEFLDRFSKESELFEPSSFLKSQVERPISRFSWAHLAEDLSQLIDKESKKLAISS